MSKVILKNPLDSICIQLLVGSQSTRDSSLSFSIIQLLLYPFQIHVCAVFLGQSYHLHPEHLKKKEKSERRETSCLKARVSLLGLLKALASLSASVECISYQVKKREPCDNVGRYQISSAQSECHSAAQMGRALIDGWALAQNKKKENQDQQLCTSRSSS